MNDKIIWNNRNGQVDFSLQKKQIIFSTWKKHLDLADTVVLIALEDLIINDLAVLNSDETIAHVYPVGIYYLIDNMGYESIIKMFSLPTYTKLKMVLESMNTNISSPEFKLLFRHLQQIKPIPAQPVKLIPNGVFWEQNSKPVALMREDEYKLVNKIEEFNSRDECSLSEQYRLYGEIRRLESKCENVVFEQALDGQSVYIPEKMELDLNDSDNTFSLSFNITDNSPENKGIQEGFNKRVDELVDSKDVYTIPPQPGSTDRIHIPFTESQREQIHNLKKINYDAKNGEDIGDAISHPEKYFDLSEIELSSTFSERVIGFGVYQPTVRSFSTKIDNEWFPGVEIVDPVEGTKDIVFKNEEEINEFSERIETAKKNDEQTVPYENYKIPISEAIQILDNAKQQFATPDKQISPSKNVLLIKENLDELEYQEVLSSEAINYNFKAIPNLLDTCKLKEYQIAGIAWLQALYEQASPGCLLADDMGLGKTLQVLSFLEWSLVVAENHQKVLIVAPKSLLENWKLEYGKFFPDGQYSITILGAQERKYSKNLYYHSQKWHSHTIIIANYETLRYNQIEFGKIEWDIVVADEAQKIKTPGTLVTNAAKALKTNFRIAITGTPVENTFQDLWCIMDFCLPGMMGSRKEFNKKYSENKTSTDDEIEKLGRALREEIGEYIQRRDKSVLSDELPPKYISNIAEHSVEFDIECSRLINNMPPLQKNVYDDVLDRMKVSGRKRNALKAITDLKQISDHPKFGIASVFDSSLKEKKFWDGFASESARMEAIIPAIDKIQKKKEKVLIFAEYRFTQYVLKMILESRYKINIRILNGDTSVVTNRSNSATRQGIVDNFNERPGFDILILSPLAAGTGLTITGANHVIHYSRHWNPAKENQATDRAYRIGQRKPVYIYYPMAVCEEYKTFDYILNDLLLRKNQLADSALFPSARNKVTEEELFKRMGEAELG